MKKIKIAHLYYDLMNLYGENGNVRFLKRKLEDQGITTEVHFLSMEDEIDFQKYDFYYIGTGSEENKEIVLQDILKYKEDIRTAIDDGKFFLVTGNSVDLFGKKMHKMNGQVLEALASFGYSVHEEEFRIVGEQYYQCDLIPHNIIGFQNRSFVMDDNGDHLFSVIQGTGYRPNIAFEGIHDNHFYGTYLLGPLLVRNPYFTDYIVEELCIEKQIEYQKPDTSAVSYKAYHEYLKNFYENEEQR